jgi:hypothetical protein
VAARRFTLQPKREITNSKVVFLALSQRDERVVSRSLQVLGNCKEFNVEPRAFRSKVES